MRRIEKALDFKTLSSFCFRWKVRDANISFFSFLCPLFFIFVRSFVCSESVCINRKLIRLMISDLMSEYYFSLPLLMIKLDFSLEDLTLWLSTARIFSV